MVTIFVLKKIYPHWALFTVEPLLWDTSIQGTPPFRGHKIWLRKNVYIMFVFVTSIAETLFVGPENQV